MSRPRVLILGGTQFIGRATVEALCERLRFGPLTRTRLKALLQG